MPPYWSLRTMTPFMGQCFKCVLKGSASALGIQKMRLGEWLLTLCVMSNRDINPMTTTANMTTPQGCSPEMPYRWVGTKQSPSKPHYLYHEDKVVLYTSDISPEYAGKVAASLNSHQALVVALGDLLHFCELAHHDSAILTAARAALALAT